MANENELTSSVGESAMTAEDINEYLKKLDELEQISDAEIEELMGDIEQLKHERDKIGDPDELSDVIINEVWSQFANQLGLDATNEGLLQKYKKDHPETYDEVAKKVMQDSNYKNANNDMKNKQQEGMLYDTYTGKKID